MSSKPFSLLSQEVIDRIVDCLAELPLWWENLSTLALVNRVFTPRCQVHLFKELKLEDEFETNKKFKAKIAKKWKILDSNHSLAENVRVLDISIGEEHNTKIFSDATFLKILNLLKGSPFPPDTLRLEQPGNSLQPEKMLPALVKASLHQTLTTIFLKTTIYDEDCSNIPLSIFPVCSKLKNITLQDVQIPKEPEELAIPAGVDPSPPKIQRLDYRSSDRLVKYFLEPPPSLEPLVDLSNLRILKACPHEKEDMACVQPILDIASETLEELYLTTLSTSDTPDERRQFPLAKLVNLKSLNKLRTFEIYVIINAKSKQHVVLRDLISVLRTFPASNSVQRFMLHVSIYGSKPFKGCLDEDWDGVCEEVVRISADKPMEFHLYSAVETNSISAKTTGDAALYQKIEDRVKVALAEHEHISFHPLNTITRWVAE
ncbi:hypothetical protein NLJ89_g995 [Agrocybe chaxingu]|uniref:Uncharacterized protein n=1 Tax=Agrocybe chaxingu TaxID=84603 RepID=A0A9W8TE13_9AGAR|nr:hypothetical protein NLJ89_g995 [Agrocybe chaxingu]